MTIARNTLKDFYRDNDRRPAEVFVEDLSEYDALVNQTEPAADEGFFGFSEEYES